MTRSYANIVTAIWRPDSPFRDARMEDQRAYLMLVTQPDVSAAGTLQLTTKWWSSLAADTTLDDVHRVLASLSDARYVVIDWDTEELLIRSFVRHDNGYNNRKRRPAILDAARATRSPLIRRALAVEFGRLGLPTAGLGGPSEDPDPHAHRPSDRASDPPKSWDTDNPDVPAVDSASSQVEGLSDSHPDRASDWNRVVGTYGDHRLGHNPQPPPPNPSPLAPDPSAATTEEGETSNPDEEHLVDQVLGIRPEWSSRSVTRTLRHPDVACRPWPVVAAAMLAVARDPDTQAPGRLRGDGPWWTAAGRTKPPPVDLPPPCGQCGPNRLIEVDGDRVARCPRCHPLFTRGAA